MYRADFAGLLPRITYTVEQVAEGARFTRAVDMHPSGLKVLMTPMMAIMVPRPTHPTDHHRRAANAPCQSDDRTRLGAYPGSKLHS